MKRLNLKINSTDLPQLYTDTYTLCKKIENPHIWR